MIWIMNSLKSLSSSHSQPILGVQPRKGWTKNHCMKTMYTLINTTITVVIQTFAFFYFCAKSRTKDIATQGCSWMAHWLPILLGTSILTAWIQIDIVFQNTIETKKITRDRIKTNISEKRVQSSIVVCWCLIQRIWTAPHLNWPKPN